MGDGEASNFASPSRCSPSFWAPEIAVTKITSSSSGPSWPLSKSMTAACRLAIEPQKSDTPPRRQCRASELHVFEGTSEARSSSTRRVSGVADQPSMCGVGWKARASTSYKNKNVSMYLMRSRVAYEPPRGDKQVYPWKLCWTGL